MITDNEVLIDIEDDICYLCNHKRDVLKMAMLEGKKKRKIFRWEILFNSSLSRTIS